jgi:hypothetical protein
MECGEGQMARLVLIETAGNQEFVFATNKLRQNIGASELIHRIGTLFVLSAVAAEVDAYAPLAAGLNTALTAGNSSEMIGTADYVKRLGAAIAEAGPVSATTPVEVLVATSGKAVLLVDAPETGTAIIRAVTLRALRDAPGAVVRGVIDEDAIELTADHKTAHARMKAIHRALDALRLKLPPPEARFPVLPITALCATSGLPAEHVVNGSQGQGRELLSEPALRKRQAAEAGWRRIKASLGHAAAGSLAASIVSTRWDCPGSAWSMPMATASARCSSTLPLICRGRPSAAIRRAPISTSIANSPSLWTWPEWWRCAPRLRPWNRKPSLFATANLNSCRWCRWYSAATTSR